MKSLSIVSKAKKKIFRLARMGKKKKKGSVGKIFLNLFLFFYDTLEQLPTKAFSD